MYRTSLRTLVAVFVSVPFIAMAQAAPFGVCAATPANLKDLICRAMELVNPVLALLTGIAVMYFMWSIVKFIRSAADDKGRAAAKDGITYGLAGLFVLFSFWGILQILWRSVFA